MTSLPPGEIGPEPFEDLLVLDLLDRADGRDRLVGSRCPQCGHLQIGKRAMCSACPSTVIEEVELSTEGTLYTYTTMHVGSPSPRTFGHIDLPEGLRILTLLDDSVMPRIGMKLVLNVDSESWVFTAPSTETVS